MNANIGTLPASGSVQITFQVTVDNPPNLAVAQRTPPRVINQGSVTGSNFGAVSTDDPTVGGATDPTVTLIDLFNTTTGLTCTPDPSANGQQVTCIATVTENPAQAGVDATGTVDFIDTSNANAVICNDVAISGPAGGPYTAQCQTSSLTVGTHNLRADYSGDGNFDASQSATYPQDVLNCTNNPIVTNANNSGAGSLRQAILDACDGTTIDFNITGAGPHTITLLAGSGALTIDKNLTINNTSGESVAVNGAAGIRVFTVNSGKTVSISNLTIGSGAPSGVNFEDKIGGGILNQGTLTLTNCAVSGNTAAEFGGGGIYNLGGTLNLMNSTVSGNHALSGGAGGGIFNNFSSTLNLTNSSVSGNDAASGGGGVQNDAGTMTVVTSTISGNTANFGGGVQNFGALTVTNSTISGNNANTDGGGIFNNHSSGTVTLTSVTVTNNRADNDNNATGTGGGIYVFNTSLQPLVQNTIVAGNFNENGVTDAADDIDGTVNSSGSFNLIGTGGAGGLTNGVNNNQVGVASAGLGSLTNNGGPTETHALQPGSPAIDQGDDFTLTTDQRGQPRPVDNPGVPNLSGGTGDGSDIGAFERGFSPIPGVTTTAGNLAYTENDPATAIDPGLIVTDDDSTNLVGATVSITTNFQAGEDVLAWIDNNGADNITLSGSSTAQTIILTGSDTVANYQAAMRAVTYVNTSNNPSTVTRTVTFTADDGANQGSNTRGITVTAQNDSPTVATNTGATVTEGSLGNTITSAMLSVTDPDNTAAQITYTVGTAPVNGTLRKSGGALAGGGTFTQADINGNLITYDHNGSETISDSFTFTVSDGAGGSIGSTPFNITVTPQNDNPTLTTNTGATVNEASTGNTITNAMLSVSDVDNTPAQITYTVGTAPANGTLRKSGTALAGGGTFTQADINGNLITYDHDGSETSSDSFTFTVSDGAGGSIALTSFTITVNAVNDPPVNTVPGPQGTNQNTPLTFSSGNGNQISVADADAGTNTIQLTLTATNGTLTLSGTTGLSFSFSDGNGTGAGDGTADATMTFRGTIADVNNALNGMTFTPTMGFSGAASLTIISNDLGNTGSGGPQSDTDVVNIQVATNISVQDAQVVEPASGSVNMIFTVSLSAPAPAGGASVDFTTQEEAPAINHATAGSDYMTTTGTVSFAAGQQVKTILVPVLSDSQTSETNETFLVVLSNPVNGVIADGTATGTILVTDQPGTLLISELRTSGPAGAGDDFVEIYNNTNSPHTVNGTGGGYGLFKMGTDCNATPVLIGVIPNGTVIPARGHFLFTGSAYSLANYGGTAAAAGDQTMSSDIENDRNVSLFSTTNIGLLSTTTRFDAVGFGTNTSGVCDLQREGTTLTPMSGSTLEYSFFRKQCDFVEGVGCSTPGTPKDTNNNSSDFLFADTASSVTVAGQRLGAPGPENLGSPNKRDEVISVSLLDSTQPASGAPNRARDFTSDPANNSMFGTLALRRRVINGTGAPVTRLRFRVVEMTSTPAPPGRADLRARTSSDSTVGGILDSSNCTEHGTPMSPPCTVTLRGTTLEIPPAQSLGGGLNSTLVAPTITLGTPLAPGASINVNFLLGVQQTGTFRFLIIVEALP